MPTDSSINYSKIFFGLSIINLKKQYCYVNFSSYLSTSFIHTQKCCADIYCLFIINMINPSEPYQTIKQQSTRSAATKTSVSKNLNLYCTIILYQLIKSAILLPRCMLFLSFSFLGTSVNEKFLMSMKTVFYFLNVSHPSRQLE